MKSDFNEADLVKIIETLEAQFKNQDELSMYRDIHEHLSLEGDFAGDDHVFSIYDKTAHAFYFVVSPFDVTSGKAPQQALVFKDGTLTHNFDYSSYANMRTGALDAVLLRSLRKPVGEAVMFGTGAISRWSMRFLKAAFPEMSAMSYINQSVTRNLGFEAFGDQYGVTLSLSDKSRLGDYSCAFLHTNSDKPVLLATDVNRMAPNAIITSYLTSYNFEEVEDSCWDTEENRIVVSWEREIENSKDLMRAKTKGTLDQSKVMTLKQIMDAVEELPLQGRVIFRSAGTPIQNAAMIKFLVAS